MKALTPRRVMSALRNRETGAVERFLCWWLQVGSAAVITACARAFPRAKGETRWPLAHFLLRGVEQVTARKVGATALVVLGVLLISWEKL